MHNVFTLVHQNIRSVRNKLDELTIFINNSCVNAVVLSEHLLEQNETIYLEGYEMASFFYRTSKRGGRTGILLQAGIDHKETRNH